MNTDDVVTTDSALAYGQRLKQLLIAHYQDQRLAKKISPQKAYHIQGFMEAGLITKLVSKDALQQYIDAAHREVFGVDYNARTHPTAEQAKLLDIPTWLRRKGTTSH
jgi:hypothetical protein